MSDTPIFFAAQQASGRTSKRLSRTFKVAVAACALLYTVSGTGAAAGYAEALQPGDDSSAQLIAETLWVGVAWPFVLHDRIWANPLHRVEARPGPNT
jgi:hypothetical protein